jgi:transposase
METFIMNAKELTKHEVVKRLIRKEINGAEAAKMINLSTRQIRRIKRKAKERGIAGIIHGNRGKVSNRKLTKAKVKTIKKIIFDKYSDFGPTFAAEKLDESHKIKISNEKLRQLMTDWGLWKIKSRKKNGEYRL